MKLILTKSLLIVSFSLFCGLSFAQNGRPEPDPGPIQEAKPAAPEIKTVQGEPVYDAVDEPAEFPGGLTGMREFLKANFKYPERGVRFAGEMLSETNHLENRRDQRGGSEKRNG